VQRFKWYNDDIGEISNILKRNQEKFTFGEAK